MRIAALLLGAVVVAAAAVTIVGFRYAYVPSRSRAINGDASGGLSESYYDLWGRNMSVEEARAAGVSARTGGVLVDQKMVDLGRHEFYAETFGNERFLTDVVGILDGPLKLPNILKALAKLHGRGTTNLRVELDGPATVGGRTFQKGEMVDTGIDVPRGSWAPLGLPVVYRGGRIRVGITCAACHSTVDPKTLQLVEGAPNADLNAGLLLALATNSAAYFMHTDIHPSTVRQGGRALADSHGNRVPLPDVAALEDAVDRVLLSWPPGNFDSMVDLKSDPSQIPSSYSLGNHPYSWSGVFLAGPFHGLSAQTNNVHALNSDSTLLADSSPALFGLDPQVYMAILLQNAASSRLRYYPERGEPPRNFWRRVDPNRSGPGLNAVVVPPTYPHATPLSPDGTYNSSAGNPFWHQVNAMAAWQNTLHPPPGPAPAAEGQAQGRTVFERAGCPACHSGPYLTNNQVIPAQQIGTDAVRAGAMAKTVPQLVPAVIFGFDTEVPVSATASRVEVPLESYDQAQLRIAWAADGAGGYKVPSLVGLAWTAPYLHDGGVAVGRDAASQLGLPGTVLRFILPDPANSLRALLDRDLRARVVAANRASPALQRVHVTGAGHEFWIDRAAGFSDQDLQSVIEYLLAYNVQPVEQESAMARKSKDKDNKSTKPPKKRER